MADDMTEQQLDTTPPAEETAKVEAPAETPAQAEPSPAAVVPLKLEDPTKDIGGDDFDDDDDFDEDINDLKKQVGELKDLMLQQTQRPTPKTQSKETEADSEDSWVSNNQIKQLLEDQKNSLLNEFREEQRQSVLARQQASSLNQRSTEVRLNYETRALDSLTKAGIDLTANPVLADALNSKLDMMVAKVQAARGSTVLSPSEMREIVNYHWEQSQNLIQQFTGQPIQQTVRPEEQSTGSLSPVGTGQKPVEEKPNPKQDELDAYNKKVESGKYTSLDVLKMMKYVK